MSDIIQINSCKDFVAQARNYFEKHGEVYMIVEMTKRGWDIRFAKALVKRFKRQLVSKV